MRLNRELKPRERKRDRVRDRMTSNNKLTFVSRKNNWMHHQNSALKIFIYKFDKDKVCVSSVYENSIFVFDVPLVNPASSMRCFGWPGNDFDLRIFICLNMKN